MRKSIKLWVVVFAFLAMPSLAFGASPWTAEEGYGDKTVGKLAFGLKNALGGWTEIITEPLDAYKNQERNFSNCVESKARGIYNAVVYTVGGLLHTGTFFIPVDVEIPDNGVEF